MKINVNGAAFDVPADWQNESLLFVLREQMGLVGAKFGCGLGQCGACTVLMDGDAVRSCLYSVSDVSGSHVTTIEGLSDDGELHPAQHAWLQEAVPQCGYCQAGQIMSAVALLENNSSPDDEAINEAMDGNLCRCGTYDRIRKAIKRAARTIAKEGAAA